MSEPDLLPQACSERLLEQFVSSNALIIAVSAQFTSISGYVTAVFALIRLSAKSVIFVSEIFVI